MAFSLGWLYVYWCGRHRLSNTSGWGLQQYNNRRPGNGDIVIFLFIKIFIFSKLTRKTNLRKFVTKFISFYKDQLDETGQLNWILINSVSTYFVKKVFTKMYSQLNVHADDWKMGTRLRYEFPVSFRRHWLGRIRLHDSIHRDKIQHSQNNHLGTSRRQITNLRLSFCTVN